jgi:SAM-dependent MidA family methyltransferase
LKNQRLRLFLFFPNMMSRKPADLAGLQQAFPYPRSAHGATTDLARLLIEEIRQSGPIPFQDYMARCLYHPELGYYARGESTTVSKKGDFMTSVSVGPVFGTLLSHRLHRFWQGNGSPDSFLVLEPGAHDGSLALDFLSAAKELDREFAHAIDYVISEPLPARRDVLQKRLGNKATIVSSPEEVHAPIGALIANEVLDALPVPLFLSDSTGWLEVLVTVENERLEWATRPAKPPLPHHLPVGYLAEGTPDFESFLSPFARALDQGLHLWIDYGLDAESLLHPARTAGTFRCYRHHRSDAHPLDHPGEQDLTADVNFTAFEEAAVQLELKVHPVLNQSRYLTHCGSSWLLNNPSPSEISQFQTLIHPTQFGNRFHALELTRGAVDRSFP